jgi:predicted DNA binding CopG/RHH family protein
MDSDIDFSDIPESTEEELKRAVRIGRPSTGKAKHLIAFRIAPGLLAKIRKLAAKRDTPYQTLLHEMLEDAVNRKAA